MSDYRVHMVSLGCPKALVDSENLLGLLAEHGVEPTESPENADVILINTCAFLQSAVEEAVENILALTDYKKNGQARALVVIGCLTERYKGDIETTLPEVDLFWGSGGLDRLPGLIMGLLDKKPQGPTALPPPGFAPDTALPRMRSAPFFRAYLKIAEGCSNKCAYCLIPSLRGPRQSRPLNALVDEAHALADSGVKELILVAQDTTSYGRDMGKTTTLPRLLESLNRVDGLEWIRLMYAYPNGIDLDLIKTLAGLDKVISYLDVPLQHVALNVVKRMGRPAKPDPLKLVERIRHAVPDMALRTTMMVGFPGETDQDFDQLMEFTAQARFNHLGVFKFSPEPGVRAANFPDQVPQRIKENRRRKLMALQRRISRQKNKGLVGKTLPVLIEGVSPETDLLLVGRTQYQAPEIDGQVYITSGTASPGSILPVRITRAHDYDLEGEIIE
jgi:ribosomal protein S12 methylthiotransferase